MVTLILVKNPFSPQDGREVKQIEAGGTLADLLNEYKLDGADMLATVNGKTVGPETEICDGDFIVIYPAIEKGGKGGGKGILGIIGAIVLSVVSFGVGGLVATGVWGSFAGASAMAAMGGYLAAAAIMFLGSSLIARNSGQKLDQGQGVEPTYSWSGVQTLEGQNNPVALTYGIVMSGGQTIAKYTMAQGSDEFLYWLVSAGEGEVEITDVKLNNNSISLYKDVTYETRTGTNDQEIISYFGDTHFTLPLNYNMETADTWYSAQAQGNATQGLIMKIECPNGLLHTTDDGSVVENWVAVQIEVQASGGSWLPYQSFPGADLTDFDSTKNALVIKGSSTKAVRKEYRIDRIQPNEYTVRVRVTGWKYSNSQRDAFATYWTGLSSIIYDDFSYPCTALLGIKAKATGQLSGSPTLSFIKIRSVVLVWNPNDEEYQQKNATNPAWACYDLLHQCRYLKNINTGEHEYEVRGVPKELMRYDDFASWAAYCDEQHYYVNIEIVSVGEILDVVNNKIAPIGHGLVVRFGTKFGCIYTHPQTPVQMFGMGNIVAGSFHEEFLKLEDRANCVQVTFTNGDANYQRDVITVYGETYDTDGYEKSAQITMDGCTKYSQAYREGVYQLLCNKYQKRTVTFECGIDSIACTVGDVVIISHDVPRWQYSGRVESVTGNTVLLPCQLEDTESTYVLQWRESANDTLHERECTIVSSEDWWTTVTITGDPVTTITAGDVFSLSVSGTENMLFTIQSITRAQDFTRTVSCIEYNEAVFEEPENYDPEESEETLYTVTIIQNPHQTITVTKFKNVESQEYTETFTETEKGWSINVSIENEPGYANGHVIINGIEYTGNIPTLPLNRNYYITAQEAEVGMVVYINGTIASWWGYVFYEEPACVTEVYKNDIVGKLVVRDMSIDGLPYDGFSIIGNNDPGSWRQYCPNITVADVSDIDVSVKTSLDTCFKGSGQLRKCIGLYYWNPINVVTTIEMFRACSLMTDVGDISQWKMPALTNASSMFLNTGIVCLDLHDWYTPNLESTANMFQQMPSLRILDVSGIDTRNATNMFNMFSTGSALQYLIIDSIELKLEMIASDCADLNRNCKILVPQSKLEDYKSWGYWANRASQFDAIENYNIIRSHGQITVVPLGDIT